MLVINLNHLIFIKKYHLKLIIKFKTLETKKHITMPVIVGIKSESNAHFRLFVSFFIVKYVVAQGKCKSEKIIVHIAVTKVQLCNTNKL